MSVCPITADVCFDHFIKGISVSFPHFYKVTDFPFLIKKYLVMRYFKVM